MPIISIIVPVYNVEAYLERCVDSILRQTFSDFELLLIDDGSEDGSGRMCDELAAGDERIKVFHKENGGLSSARNYGLDRASAPYIGFVDSDDYIEPTMYETLYTDLTREGADVSVCGRRDIYWGAAPDKASADAEKRLVVGAEEAIKIVLEGRIATANAWNKLYKRELFDAVRYPEGRIVEDAFVIVDILRQTKKVVISTRREYNYVHRENSISTRSYTPRDLDAIAAYEHNYEIVKNEFPAILDAAKHRICWAHFYVLDKMVMSDNVPRQQMKDVVGYLRKNVFFILGDRRFNLSRRAAMALLLFSTKLYKRCVALNNRHNRRLYE